MKKLVLLTAIVASVASYAATSNSADMNISATVMKPASISTVQDLEFGKIIAGFNHEEQQAGKFNVKFGEETAPNITYSFGGKNLDIKDQGKAEIQLSNGSYNMPVALNITKGSVTSSGNGNAMDITVKGTAKPANDQAVGRYTGVLTARISYN